MQGSSTETVRRLLAGASFVATLALGGCVSQETRREAVEDINRAFRAENEAVVAKRGTRVVSATTGDALDATRAALERLGMTVRQQSVALGLITVDAPAPSPLTQDEWDRAGTADLPKARALLARHVGPLANLFTFEPQGLLVVINATVIETRGGTEISFTMRMREVEAPKSGMPRREYPPPSAVEIGIDKIWIAIGHELTARGHAFRRN